MKVELVQYSRGYSFVMYGVMDDFCLGRYAVHMVDISGND